MSGGVFLKKNRVNNICDPGSLALSFAVWLISAGIISMIASKIIFSLRLSESCWGYFSSGISFLAAAASGIITVGRRGKWNAGSTAINALFLVIALLTVGYLISDGELDQSAIMSTVSFTFSGYLLSYLTVRKKPAGSRITVRKLT